MKKISIFSMFFLFLSIKSLYCVAPIGEPGVEPLIYDPYGDYDQNQQYLRWGQMPYNKTEKYHDYYDYYYGEPAPDMYWQDAPSKTGGSSATQQYSDQWEVNYIQADKANKMIGMDGPMNFNVGDGIYSALTGL